MSSTITEKQSDELASGDVVEAPAKNGATAWRRITAIEESPHGEYAIQFANGDVLIAEAWDRWAVRA